MNKNPFQKVLKEVCEQEVFLATYRKLNEVAFHRIFDKYFQLGFIAISANRSCEAEKGVDECSPEEVVEQEKQNRKNFVALKSDVRKSGYGFVPVRGGYQEKLDDGTRIQVEEPSLIIPDMKQDSASIKELGVKLCRKFNQDSFLWKPPTSEDNKAYFIDQQGQIDMSFDDVKINDLEQMFYSYLAKGNTKTKRWSLTENKKPVFFIPKPPGSLQSAAGRQGEYFFLAESGLPFSLRKLGKKKLNKKGEDIEKR